MTACIGLVRNLDGPRGVAAASSPPPPFFDIGSIVDTRVITSVTVDGSTLGALLNSRPRSADLGGNRPPPLPL